MQAVREGGDACECEMRKGNEQGKSSVLDEGKVVEVLSLGPHVCVEMGLVRVSLEPACVGACDA